MIKLKYLNRFKSKSQLIFQSPLLRKMSYIERHEFLRICHRRWYVSGEYVYHQGDPGTGLYLLEEGSVELLYQENPSDEPVHLEVVHPPDSFGAFSVETPQPRKASAKCTTDAMLYGFFVSDYQSLSKRHPKIALRLLESLVKATNRKLGLALEHLEKENHKEASALLFETLMLPQEETEEEESQPR